MDKFYRWFAWKLPHGLIKWCGFRIAAYATIGQWSSQLVPGLTLMDALKRWDEQTAFQEPPREPE